MSTPTRFGIQGLQPAFDPGSAVERVASLPWGGPTGVGGAFAQGSLLGCTGVAAQNEVATLAFTGGATGGTFTVSYTGDKVYQSATLAYNVSLAALRAALVAMVPEWSGNLTVTGTPSASGAGGTYTCTFNTDFASQRIGGLFSLAAALTGGTSPAGTWTRTTRGSCGVAQMDLYVASTNEFADAFLKYDVTLSPGGALVSPGIATSLVALNQPHQPTVYVAGTFLATDTVGVDATAYTLPKLVKVGGGVYVRLR